MQIVAFFPVISHSAEVATAAAADDTSVADLST